MAQCSFQNLFQNLRIFPRSDCSFKCFPCDFPSPRKNSKRSIAAQASSQHRVFVVSDLHADYAANAAWCRALDDNAYRQDILLLAGDVCDEISLLQDTLALLLSKFGSVFYCYGNHELWIRSADEAANSWEKLEKIMAICDDLGVHTTPKRLGNVWIAPFHSWHHKSFDTEPDIPGIPAASTLTVADYAACTFPPHLPGSSNRGSAELAETFDQLNNIPEWDAMVATRETCNVIAFSHFLPELSLIPEKRYLFFPNLVKACGSVPLGRRVARLKPDIHVFGHTHFAWDATLQGTRFIQAPLCSPAERQRRLMTICFDAFMMEGKEDPEAATWLPLEIFTFNSDTALDFESLYTRQRRQNEDEDNFKGSSTASSSSLFSKASERDSRELQGPVLPPQDKLTAVGEAVHGVRPIVLDNVLDEEGSTTPILPDDPLIDRVATNAVMYREQTPPSAANLQVKAVDAHPQVQDVSDGSHTRQQLQHGSMPGPLGAHWSDYYTIKPRNPEDLTLAPWVEHVYRRRHRSSSATTQQNK